MVTVYDSKYIALSQLDWSFSEVAQDEMAKIHPYPARFVANYIGNFGKRFGYIDNSSLFSILG